MPTAVSNPPPSTFFLATDFLDLRATSPSGSGLSLAAKLAKLHNTPAHIPDGFDRPMFGFPVTTCCGDIPQDDAWTAAWAEFYAKRRVRAVLRAARNPDDELKQAVEKVASAVVPRLIGGGKLNLAPTPVLVHGDLWSGNHGTGRIDGEEGSGMDSTSCF